MQANASHEDHYLSAVDAGKQFGYTNDYIARLAREKKVVGVQRGRQWYVDARTLETFKRSTEELKKKQAEKVREERKRERANFEKEKPISPVVAIPVPLPAGRISTRAEALAKAGMIVSLGVVAGGLFFTAASGVSEKGLSSASVMDALRSFASSLYMADSKAEAVPHDMVSRTAEVTPKSPEVADEGIVVLPPGEDMTRGEVQAMFSDKIEVTFDEDGKGGLVKPIFKSGAEATYRFLMVPLGGE